MKILKSSILLTLWFVVLTGLVFPLVIYGIGQAAFPGQANGSIVSGLNGSPVGSSLIGQSFSKPEFFHPRPSAAGSGYDAANSGGTNLGPTSDKLINGAPGFPGVKQLAEAYRKENGLPPSQAVPVDAVTRSASGLDPDISVENALLQCDRVAKARGMRVEEVRSLVTSQTEGRLLGIYGEPRVNVLQMNQKLLTLPEKSNRV